MDGVPTPSGDITNADADIGHKDVKMSPSSEMGLRYWSLASAAVARAAAAAAKVASNAALQAKLLADEAVNSGGYRNPSQDYNFCF